MAVRFSVAIILTIHLLFGSLARVPQLSIIRPLYFIQHSQYPLSSTESDFRYGGPLSSLGIMEELVDEDFHSNPLLPSSAESEETKDRLLKSSISKYRGGWTGYDWDRDPWFNNHYWTRKSVL